MYALGAAVESATGLAGYDPQLDLPIAEAAGHPDAVVACFEQAAEARSVGWQQTEEEQ
jgi:hypothetical protein